MDKETTADKKKRCEHIYSLLHSAYPDARCTLDNHSPEQFLLAAILSPQCTDITANKVTKALWKKFMILHSIADAEIFDIEEVIRPCGMYKVKARYIKKTAIMLRDRYGGVVPNTLEKLMEFPGVGRKVALVVLLEVFGKVEGIIIDTHNIRLVNRIGLVSTSRPDALEQELLTLVPKKYWALWSHLMVHHGRSVCTARSPKCAECILKSHCEQKF